MIEHIATNVFPLQGYAHSAIKASPYVPGMGNVFLAHAVAWIYTALILLMVYATGFAPERWVLGYRRTQFSGTTFDGLMMLSFLIGGWITGILMLATTVWGVERLAGFATDDQWDSYTDLYSVFRSGMNYYQGLDDAWIRQLQTIISALSGAYIAMRCFVPIAAVGLVIAVLDVVFEMFLK